MESRPGTESGASYDPTVQAPPPEKASVVEDFIDIFHAPSTVFARREKSGYGMPLLIVSVLSALFAFANRSIFVQIFDAEFQRASVKAMAGNPRITQDMMNTQRGISEGIASVATYVGTPIFIFIMALLVWLAAKVVSGKITYGQAVLITTLAWVPRLVSSLLTTVQVLLMDTSNVTSPFTLSFSPARFMDADATNPKLFALLGSFDLFTLWFTVLVGIGIAVMGKVPRSRGYLAAGLVFIVGVIPAVLFK
jgi:hypothetical protein